jgi:hypothetical protein
MNRLAWFIIFVFASLALPARGQEAVSPDDVPAISKLIDSGVSSKSLKCEVRPWSPFLDFNFRFETGFLASFRPAGKPLVKEVITYLRITPEKGGAVLLRETFDFPATDAALNAAGALPRGTVFSVSGAFNIGEGRYAAELLLVDGSNRCYRRWSVETSKPKKGEAVPLALKPETVTPIAPETWDGKLDPNGARLAILLDAAPIDPFAAQLHAWDRAMLLQTLGSLLRQVPCRSVELVVFNVEQQRKLFRSERLDASGFSEIEGILKHTEQDTIPYQALRPKSWHDFLVGLAKEEVSAKDPPDAVVFVGPATRSVEKVPTKQPEIPRSRFFYFKFHEVGPVFPDAIDRLTKDLHGTVFPFYSAKDLAQAIQKLMAQVNGV